MIATADEPQLRSFQAEVYANFVKGAYKGILKAVPGSGKTIAALEVIKQYDPGKVKSVLVVVPSRALLKQWLNIIGLNYPNIRLSTINMARKTPADVDLLVVDEIHRTTSAKNCQLYSVVKYKAILGMSATPNRDCAMYAGQVIQEVPFSQALGEGMIANFKVIFNLVDMNAKEGAEYLALTHQMSQIFKSGPPEWFHKSANYRINCKEYMKFLALKRRAIVYDLASRPAKALSLIHANAGKKIIVFCQRIEQAEALARMVGPDTGVHHSKAKDDAAIARFRSGASNVLVTVRTLTEGFDVPDIDVVIVMSTATTEAYHIQTLGRGIRKFGDKLKKIHILLGRGTTDEKVLSYAKQYDSEIEGVPIGTKPSKCAEYYDGEIYSIDHRGGIFKNTKYGRDYYDAPPELSAMVHEKKRSGGRFTIGKDGTVRIREGDHAVVLGKVDITKITPRPKEERPKQLTFAEVFAS